MSRRTLINLIFFNGVFALMLFWAVNNIVTVDRLERPYEITGDFAQAVGVKADAEVTYLGVHYGRISSVDRTDDGVRITMKIDRGKDIPAGSIARLFRKSAVGEPYIDFVPPEDYDASTAGRIEPGENVPIERTSVPLEFSELLRSASALVESVEPDQVGSLVHELAAALEGRGESLRTITESVDRLTASFVERTEQLDRLAENNTRLTAVLAEHRLSLGQSLANLRAVAETLRDADSDTRRLLDLGPDFLGVTADLVADQKRNLDCLLTDLAPVLRTLNQSDNLSNLEETLIKGPTAFGYAAMATDQEADGRWVRVNLLVEAGGELSDAYVPPKTLPVVPSVPACASTLTPAVAQSFSGQPGSVGAVPAPDTAAGNRPQLPSPADSGPAPAPAAGSGGSLAETGIAVAATLALALAVAGLVTWRIRRPRST